MRFKDDISGRLKAARKELKLNQTEMAEAAGASFGSWQSYEAGKQAPGSQVIAGMVQLGINANWVLCGEGPMLLKDLQAQRFDVETLQNSIETLENVLEVNNKIASPAQKAELVALIYDIVTDDSSTEDSRRNAVFKLLKVVG